MKELIYPHERTLGPLTFVLGLVAWSLLIIGTLGTPLIFLAVGFLAYLFAQSSLIAYMKGNGVELSAEQFPDLYAQFTACCERLQMQKYPKAYILQGGGALNAFATKFLCTRYVVLLSDVVDAMDQHPDGVRFYIGHELGHLRMKHLDWPIVRWPVLWLPLLGAAYSRSRESSCDRHGLACSSSPENAARALVVLAAGPKRWEQLNMSAYLDQTKHSSGFWMSFHELTAAYPWLTKRAARVMDAQAVMPKRSVFAYLLALFVPYAGRLGAGFGFLMMVYIVALTSAIALPAYYSYIAKAELNTAITDSQEARDALITYYEAKQEVPTSLEMAGVPEQLTDGSPLSLNPDGMMLTVGTEHGDLVFVPKVSDQGDVFWTCTHGEGLKPEKIPEACEHIGEIKQKP